MDLKSRLINAKRKIFEKAYGYLNDKQKEAVFSTEGPLLVLAGAGSGKTTVLVQRIAYMVRYGNAYYSENISESLLFEPYVEKLEKIADMEAPEKALIESAMESFAETPVFPYQILAITFTNKAANEIKQRLEKNLGDKAYDIWAGTFHSVCAKLLRMYIDRLGFASTFTIYDTDDQRRLMKTILKDFDVSDKTFPPKTVLNAISRAKEQLIDERKYEEAVGEHDLRRKTVARLYKEYEKRKRAANALDFDDLIMLTVKLFEEDAELLEKYRRKFKYILVDEYQDTNIAQFKLTKMLCNDNLNIMVVGDDDQSIYKFRGATIDNILNFDRIFEGTKIVKLEQNYRSTGTIVSAANKVIENNVGRKGKTLCTDNPDGEKITVKCCESSESEAQYIANKITDLVADGTYRFEDFAILYRMNTQSREFETVFAKSSIPYRIIGGLRFYERKEIKDVIAYLCVLANPGDSLRMKRIINVPKRGIGDATVEELEKVAIDEGRDMLYCADNAAAYPSLKRSAAKLAKFAELMKELRQGYRELPLGVLVEKVLEKSGYLAELAALDEAEAKDRTSNVKELVSNAAQYANNNPETTLENFLEEVALVADIDNYDKDANAVVMMTVHSAKGLEFPVVFLPGMEEGVFPGSQTIMDAENEMEEERRLAYVAITRAKERLFVLHCRHRLIFGKTEYHPKSRFAEEIPEEFCTFEVNDVDLVYAKNEYQDAGRASFGSSGGSYKSTETYKAPAASDSYAYNKARALAERRRAAEEKSIEMFAIGQRVMHPVFKAGTVLGVKQMGTDTLYEIAFDESGTKKIMGKFAKMKSL